MRSTYPVYNEVDNSDFSEYYFFYSGQLSNWAPISFVDLLTQTEYNCSEQYLMHQKALLFDPASGEEILQATSPLIQKSLGRLVKNFNPLVWEQQACQLMYQGCYFKFSQNPNALSLLLSTEGKLLVEASPKDVVWGIGMGEWEPGVEDPKNWKGKNWLGKVLTSLRESLLESGQGQNILVSKGWR